MHRRADQLQHATLITLSGFTLIRTCGKNQAIKKKYRLFACVLKQTDKVGLSSTRDTSAVGKRDGQHSAVKPRALHATLAEKTGSSVNASEDLAVNIRQITPSR